MKLEYKDVSNPRWTDQSQTSITVDLIFPHLVAFDPKYATQKIAFNAVPTDIYEHGREIYERAVAGAFGAIGLPPAAEPIGEVQFRVWEKIKGERDRRKGTGVKVGTHWFHSDDASRIQWLAMKDTARDNLDAGGAMGDPIVVLGNPVQWKTMAGAFIDVTAQLVYDVVKATKELDARLFAIAEAKRVEMEALAAPETYDVLSGWPPCYEDEA